MFVIRGMLRAVNAGVSGEKIAEDAGDSGEGSRFRAKELEGHEGGSDRRIGGAGEDGYEAHSGEERCR